jgi:hypothetical protein
MSLPKLGLLCCWSSLFDGSRRRLEEAQEMVVACWCLLLPPWPRRRRGTCGAEVEEAQEMVVAMETEEPPRRRGLG